MENAAVFDIPTLRRQCEEVLGVEKYIFDGAFFRSTGKYTIKEAKAVIDKWLKAPLKEGGDR